MEGRFQIILIANQARKSQKATTYTLQPAIEERPATRGEGDRGKRRGLTGEWEGFFCVAVEIWNRQSQMQLQIYRRIRDEVIDWRSMEVLVQAGRLSNAVGTERIRQSLACESQDEQSAYQCSTGQV